MATYDEIGVNHIGKGLTVKMLKGVLDFLPDDVILAPNATTNNLSIYTPDFQNVAQLDFMANDIPDAIEIFNDSFKLST